MFSETSFPAVDEVPPTSEIDLNETAETVRDEINPQELIERFKGNYLPESQFGEKEQQFISHLRELHSKKWEEYLEDDTKDVPRVSKTITEELCTYLEQTAGRRGNPVMVCGSGWFAPEGGYEWISREFFEEEVKRLTEVKNKDAIKVLESLTIGQELSLKQYRNIYSENTYISHGTSKILNIISYEGLFSRRRQEEVAGESHFTTKSNLKPGDIEKEQIYFNLGNVDTRYATFGYFMRNQLASGKLTPRGIIVMPTEDAVFNENTSFISGDGLGLFHEGGFADKLEHGFIAMSESDYKRLTSPKLIIDNPEFEKHWFDTDVHVPSTIEVENKNLTEKASNFLENHLLRDKDGNPILIPDKEFDDASKDPKPTLEIIDKRARELCGFDPALVNKIKTSMIFEPLLEFGDNPEGSKTFKRKVKFLSQES
jgi:hypothetical protein